MVLLLFTVWKRGKNVCLQEHETKSEYVRWQTCVLPGFQLSFINYLVIVKDEQTLERFTRRILLYFI